MAVSIYTEEFESKTRVREHVILESAQTQIQTRIQTQIQTQIRKLNFKPPEKVETVKLGQY